MNKTILLFVLSIVIPCKGKFQTTRNVRLFDTNKVIEVPVFTIQNKYTKIENPYFNHVMSGMPIKEKTFVSMRYDNDFLEIKFECRNNPRLHQNYYTKDNSYMFHQEVFELFISNGEEAKEHYLEIELNPNNALFLGKITNKYKSDKLFKLDFIDTSTSGIVHTVEKDSKNRVWKGYLKIPVLLLGYPSQTSKNIYRINMFRIISNKDQVDKNWKADPNNATFACWSSPMTHKPRFHVPDYFGFLIFEK